MKLKTGQKAAFGFGAFGKAVVYMLISSYLLYYYNVVLGMSSVFIGTVMMAARVFDAFNDPIMGIIVAKTKTRWGRFRPWILAGTVLNAVTILCFICDAGIDGRFCTENLADRLLLCMGHYLYTHGYSILVHDSGNHRAGRGS